MRKAMKSLNKQRFTVTGTFERFGVKNGYMGQLKTILLKDVKKDGNIITDHIWFTCGKTFEKLDLHTGDIIEFDARVAKYEKGYKGRKAWETGEYWSETDYKLERPTKARVIHRKEIIDNP